MRKKKSTAQIVFTVITILLLASMILGVIASAFQPY